MIDPEQVPLEVEAVVAEAVAPFPLVVAIVAMIAAIVPTAVTTVVMTAVVGLFVAARLRNGDEIAIGVDARDGIVATSGWTEQSQVSATDLVAHMAALGVRRVIYTDIARDGTLSEPNFAATGALVRPGGPAIIASGGVGRIEHLQRLAGLGVEAVIVGRALYTGVFSLPEALAALAKEA